ncbi:MAG: indolepyruvate ferredoxin oxidoreductase family protein, partial [Alphaproteobacteria bacterium]
MKKVRLTDRYDLEQERVFVTGAQAVIRLALTQHERDRRAGLSTAGYITGYRGSPIGTLDQQLAGARPYLEPRSILFQPGLNEDLAATALWGSQQAELRGEGKYDGVFGIWYGKGPGVDRSGDVFRHANHAGTSKHGGVIALMGDDHTCESSTSAHQSEFAFVDAMMPVLNPAGVQEVLDYGLYGFALSRFAGVWTGIKCVKDNIEQTASIDGRVDRVEIILPEDFDMPEGGLGIRLGDSPLEKEARLHRYKRPAMLAFARANGLDRIILSGGRAPKIGVITTGKSYLDVAEALELLGIDEVAASKLGLRLYKVAMTWPLEPEGVARFASGLDLIIVVEEKRSLIETQVKEQLYGTANAPAIVGKQDEKGATLFQPEGALEPVQIALAIGERLHARTGDAALRDKLEELGAARARARNTPHLADRIAYFCPGCPHNSSTVVPEGARAYAGIGCHYMVQWMNRATEGFTQMGGEGANWIGEAPFSKREHVYQNLGDGTYVHSGILAIRAAIAAGTTMTFKLLYNDAVAMTGGQRLDGGLTVPQIARQVLAEGAKRVEVVSEDVSHYSAADPFPEGVGVHPREQLDVVQRGLAEEKGVTVLIYDQTCAAEKRRRRRRGEYPDPPKRVFINELVCEGCGDCGIQSNCVAIAPVDTEFGRKREIDQSACNKDFSCLKGFCPSFVTVHGGALRKGAQGKAAPPPQADALPDPVQPELGEPYSLVVTGIGGTGVVTIGALIGMAAHIEEKGIGVIDMSGIAQKGGAVSVHIRVSERPEDIKAIRASAAGANLILGCDLVVAGSDSVLGVVREGVTTVIANDHETMTGEFASKPDFSLPIEELKLALQSRAGADATRFIDATRIAGILLGDTIAANIFLLGYACQLGHLPVSAQALMQAIELNGVAVERNIQAFNWGRMAAHDPEGFSAITDALVRPDPVRKLSATLDEAIARRADYLTAYQNEAYAERYRGQVAAFRRLEEERTPGMTGLAQAVAEGLFKLMAVKDEYEVARLYTEPFFTEQLERVFTGDYQLEFHLAPPLLSRTDPLTGRPVKRSFGPWVLKLFRLLAAM